MDGLNEFMDEILRLVEDGDRQYGVANASYTEYFIERLELCIISCIDLRDRMLDDGSADLQDYCATLNQLIECLRMLFYRWLEYEDIVESALPVGSVSYQAPLLRRSRLAGPGRPSFYISKDQLVYLSSLSFKWKDIAAILNVSRMTIYRLVAASVSPCRQSRHKYVY